MMAAPQLRLGKDSEAERRATWLELFYDLVFVVAIAQLAHKLNEAAAIWLVSTGVGMEHVVLSQPGMLLSPANLWLICGAVALCFLALGIIHQTTVAAGTHSIYIEKLV